MQENRKKTRRFLFQKLYSFKFNTTNQDLFLESFFDGEYNFLLDDNYIEEISKLIIDKKEKYNQIINRYAPRFDIENMSYVYILPIYIALSEIFLLKEEIPIKVSINEAIGLVKRFGDDSGKKIVNGILNKVLNDYDKLKTEFF